MIHRDFGEIKEDGVLRAITIYSATSYFLYRGRPMGFEYELLERLANHLDLRLEIVMADDINDLFDMLNRGEGDLIAYGLTVTAPRRKLVNFTRHHFVTHQVLVQRKPENWRKMKLHEIQKELVTNALDLIDDTVHVRKNSSYFHRLKNLSQEMGGAIHIKTISGNYATGEIIQMVVNGKVKYTIADYSIAAINQTYYPILDISTPVSFSQRIAWAVRKNSPDLLAVVNEWIKGMKKETDYYVIYNKYFRNKKLFKRRIRSEFYSLNTGKISLYDTHIKRHAGMIGWDWRLISSLIYQESRFEEDAESWAGGKGLMQLMPATARELGVNNRTDPAENIEGGIKYLGRLWDRWDDIADSVQRIKFVLASYNCGYHHVRDAQRLAEKYGKAPLVWDENVEEYILKLSFRRYFQDEVVEYGYVRGSEPYEYVREIFERYDHYRKFIPA
ncbi:MAG: transporter substrate-binding domain-containing protein [Bacteroidales bacterium]